MPGIGHENCVAVRNRDKTNVSRRGKVNDRGKKMAYRHLKDDIESW